MRIQEVARQTDLTRRAIIYYEEKGLLRASKSENGYREYSPEDVRILKEISAYRKLGIGIKDIRTLLSGGGRKVLLEIYENKKAQLSSDQKELEALERFLKDRDADTLYRAVDYDTIAQAMQDMLPGFYGYFFLHHFLPYLQVPITTREQQEAYERILAFWDTVQIRIPLPLRIISYLSFRFSSRKQSDAAGQMEAQLQRYTRLSEQEYEVLKEQTRKNVRRRNRFFIRHHPFFLLQRRFMKQLQDCGYNDIFLPNLMILSPPYREYREALMKVNDRICRELGLYYDSDYRLNIKSQNDIV